MRHFFVTGLLGLVTTGFAQEALNAARNDLGGKATNASQGGVPVLQTLLAVAIVIGLLKLVLPKLLPHLAKTKLQTSLGSTIVVEESATLTNGQLLVLKVRGRTLLVGQTATGFNTLADLTEQEATAMAEPAFFELVDAAPGTMPTHAVIPTEAQIPAPDREVKAARLARLQKLIGE